MIWPSSRSSRRSRCPRIRCRSASAGWAPAILEADLATSAGPRGRVVALFRLLDHLAVVRIDAPPTWLAAERVAIAELLLAARVDWGAEPVALAQLWGA